MATIHYQVKLHSLNAHLFEIVCTIPAPVAEGQRFSLPAWIPGSYLVRDFARHITRIEAESEGKQVHISKLDKSTWQCAPCKERLTIRYQVYAYDLSVRTAYLDQQRAYFNGTSLFIQVEGKADAQCEVSLEAGPKPSKSWRVATTLPQVKVNKQGYGIYKAENYTTLIDHPVEISDLAIGEFKAKGIPHRIIISGKHKADLKRITKDLKQLCEYHIGFFGTAPFKRYDFMLYAAADNQYGGLEHRDSTSLICPRSWLPNKDTTTDETLYQDFLGLCSHEYFHAWHVKRIRPEVFANPDLAREAYTRLLWVFEGFTAYYDTLALRRSGLIYDEAYLKALSKDISRFLRTPGRTVQALDESSFDTWIKLYRPDENTPNAQISYYLKGSLVALAIDLTLRIKGHSLDEVMRGLWHDYTATGKLVAEEDMAALIRQYTGQDLRKLLAATVQGNEDPPLTKLFSQFGVLLEAEHADSNLLRDRAGLQLASEQDTRISHVFSGSPAESAGLAAGDTLIAADRIKLTAKSLKDLVKHQKNSTPIRLHFFRRDELISTDIVLGDRIASAHTLKLKGESTGRPATLRTGWLNG